MKNSFEKLIDIINVTIDPKIGIINKIFEKKHQPRFNHFYHFCARTANVNVFCKQRNFNFANGVGISQDKAIARAIGEALERYSSAIYDKEKLPFFSSHEVEFNCVDHKKFPFYSKKNCWQKFDQHSKLHWTTSKNLLTHKEIYMPASLVYLPYFPEQNEAQIFQNISTGLACHTTLDDAIISGICEIVERDAFMLFWKNRISPPKITFESLPSHIKNLISLYKQNLCMLTLFDMTSDIKIPSVLATLESSSEEHPALVISASCKPNMEDAILSAIEELEMTRDFAYRKKQESTNKLLISDIVLIKEQKDHLLFWSEHENIHYANFLLKSTKEINFSKDNDIIHETSEELLKKVIEPFKSMKMDVFFSDVTSIDLKNIDVSVVRVIIPEMCPLFFGYENEQYLCGRLLSFAKNNNAIKNQVFEYLPHPFP